MVFLFPDILYPVFQVDPAKQGLEIYHPEKEAQSHRQQKPNLKSILLQETLKTIKSFSSLLP